MGQSDEGFTSRQNRYQNFQGLEKLGDRAFKKNQFEKATEYYKKALSFLDTDHRKYNSTLDKLKNVEQCIYREKYQQNNKKTLFLEECIIISDNVFTRLYSSVKLDESDWYNLAGTAFVNVYDSDN